MSIVKRYSPSFICFAIAVAAAAGLQPTRTAFVTFALLLTVTCVIAEVERARIRGALKGGRDAASD